MSRMARLTSRPTAVATPRSVAAASTGTQQGSRYRRGTRAVPDRVPGPSPWDGVGATPRIRAEGRHGVSNGVSNSDPTDAEIIVRSLDQPARFATVFDRHYDAIHRYLWTRVGRRAEDVTSEVFKVAFQQRERYDPSFPSARPWLFGIAARLAKQQHRHEARNQELVDRIGSNPADADPASPEERLHALAPSSPVADALMQLPARDREPLLLHVWDDLPYEEVARALDVPLGTVRSRIHRAREELRSRLTPEGGHDEPAQGGAPHG